MKRLHLFLICVLYLNGSLRGQSSIFIHPDTEEKGIENAGIKKSEKNVLRRGFNNWAEEHPILSGESLASAIARSHSELTDSPLNAANLDSALTVDKAWGTVYFLDKTATDAAYPSQFYTKSLLLNDTIKNGSTYYDAATFTFYNKDLKEQHTITVDLTKYSYCNDIIVLNQFSRQFFNSATSSKLVYIFLIHYFEPAQRPTDQKYACLVVDETGTLLTTIPDASGVYLYYNSSNSKIIVDKWKHQQDSLQFDVYNARNFHTNPTLRKTHKFGADVLTNIDGPLLGVKRIGTADYYYFSHYEKPFWKSQSPNWEAQEDNSFIIELFNCSNTNLYKTIKLPVIGFTPQTVSSIAFDYSFSDYSLTTNVFNSDNKIELIYATSHYFSNCDCYKEKYYLVNEDAEILDSIPLLIGGDIVKLANLKGFDAQYALMEQAATGSGIAKIHFFDLQSWNMVNTFNAVHEGELLSLNFERTLIDKEHYAYVFRMGNPFTENGNVYSKVNWYNPDGTLYKNVKFNLGPNGIYFASQIGKSTLNPYLFNSDDKMEYIGFAQIKNGSTTVNSVRIYSEDGELLFQANDDPVKGRIGSGLYTVSEGKQYEYFIVSYSKGLPNVPVEYNFYKLPFSSFGGGNGTEDNPYIIRSAGDFDLIRRNLKASYALANDIDMATILNTQYASSGWLPIGTFQGKIDGQGYAVHNFKLENNSDGSAALFSDLGTLAGSKVWIKNLHIVDAEITTSSSNSNLAFLAGRMTGPTAGSLDSVYIYNCHVSGNITEGNGFPANGNIGGIVGQASSYAGVTGSSFEGTIQNTAGAAVNPKIGGILGNAMTSAYVNASHTKGQISIENGNLTAIGGIVGSVQNGVSVRNSYSSMNLKGSTDVGGVAGSFTRTPKGLIENCYATGTIIAEKASGNYYAGGVIGSTDVNSGHISGYYPNQTVNKTSLNMSGLIALNDSVTALYANRVSGKSAEANASAELLNGAFTLDSIRYCYALSTLKIGPAGTETAISSTDANNIDGADITMDALTKEFYTGIGWNFGNTVEAPWVWNENGKPRLWYEYQVTGVILNNLSAHIDVTETLQLIPTVYPADAKNQNITWASSDPEIASVGEASGLVTGLKFGTATITVTTEEGGFTASCVVRVGIAETIALNKNELILKKSEEEVLTVDILPEEAVYRDVTWKSSVPEIATVDAGKVTAIAEGECFIVVSLNNSDLADTCKIIVTRDLAIQLPDANHNVSLINTKERLEINSQETMEQVNIYDVDGKSVYTSPERATRFLISTARWNKGVYIVKITGNNMILRRKLIVQ
ncbi:MAG: Ig-like domain-containing protein [Dysgonamonadaceae bacterium]|nr:Ig-like domain-containing protein [Dysgonamonadaceae bacterium]